MEPVLTGTKAVVGARAHGMNGLGDEFLAGSAFAGNQHRGAAGGHLGDEVHHLLHLVALAHQVGKGKALEGAAKLQVLSLKARLVQQVADFEQQLVVIPGLGDVALGAFAGGLEGHLAGVVRGNHDHADFRRVMFDDFQQIQAVAVRKINIEQHEVEHAAFDSLQAFFRRWKRSRPYSLPSGVAAPGFRGFPARHQ